MTKPAKEGQEGFDPNSLMREEKPEGAAAEGADDHESDDDLSIEELDAQLAKALDEALASEDDDPQGDEDDGEEQPADDDLKARLAKTEAELKALKKKDRKAEEIRQRKAVAQEIIAVAKEFKLTKAELDNVTRFYVKNPELEGVVPFRQAAIRVLGLGDRATDPASDGRNGGSPRGERTPVITRGGGGPAPKREPFKPVASRGDYSNVTSALMRDGNIMRALIKPTD